MSAVNWPSAATTEASTSDENHLNEGAAEGSVRSPNSPRERTEIHGKGLELVDASARIAADNVQRVARRYDGRVLRPRRKASYGRNFMPLAGLCRRENMNKCDLEATMTPQRVVVLMSKQDMSPLTLLMKLDPGKGQCPP